MSWDDPQAHWSATDPLAGDAQSIPVITAVLGPDESEIARILSRSDDALLVRRCLDVAELVGAVQAGIGAVAVVSSDQLGFDRTLIAALQAEGVALIAINDPLDQFSTERMNALGVRHWLPSRDLSVHLVSLLRDATSQLGVVAGQINATTRQPPTHSRLEVPYGTGLQAQAELESTVRRNEIPEIRSQARAADHETSVRDTSDRGTAELTDSEIATASDAERWTQGLNKAPKPEDQAFPYEHVDSPLGGPAKIGGAASKFTGLGDASDDELHELFAADSRPSFSDGSVAVNDITDGKSPTSPVHLMHETTEHGSRLPAPAGANNESVWSPRTPPVGTEVVRSEIDPSIAQGAGFDRRNGTGVAFGTGGPAIPSSKLTTGHVIAVWSGHGAPGRSTVAAGLATAFSQGLSAKDVSEVLSLGDSRAGRGRIGSALFGKPRNGKSGKEKTPKRSNKSGKNRYTSVDTSTSNESALSNPSAEAGMSGAAGTPDPTNAHPFASSSNLANASSTSTAGTSNTSAPHQSDTAVSSRATILMDADTYAPSQAQALGLLEESSGLAMACRSANQGLLTISTLRDAAVKISSDLDLLTGLPNVSRWSEIGAHSFEAVIEQARVDYDWTVIDCAPPVEQDEMLSFDTRAPQRNSATNTALRLADLVVIVGKSDPVGIKRLVSAISEFKDSEFGRTPFVVVVNQAPTRVSGKDRRAQIEKALKRFAGEETPVFIPFEPKSASGSLEIGKAVTEARRKGEIGTAIVSLGSMIVGGFLGQDSEYAQTENPVSRVKMLV